jgi:hypothetical protein
MRGENGGTATVPDAAMAECGFNAFTHSVSFQPDSTAPRDRLPALAPTEGEPPCRARRFEAELGYSLNAILARAMRIPLL